MRKLRGKLVSVIGIFSFIGIGVLTAVIIILASNEVSRMIDEQMFTIAEQNGEKMKGWLEEYMGVARTMAHIMEGYKDMPPAERRGVFDLMLRQVTAAHPELNDSWSQWAPNALDGMDAEHANTPGTDESGRYISSWYSSPEGTPYLVPITSYTWEMCLEQLDYSEAITEPSEYYHPAKGKVLTSIFCVPVLDGDEIVGYTGVTLELSTIQQMAQAIKPFGNGFAFVFSGAGAIVAHTDASRLGMNIRDTESDTFGASLDRMVRAIETGSKDSFSVRSPVLDTVIQYHTMSFTIGRFKDPWTVVIGVPRSTIMAPVYRLLVISLVVEVVIAILLALYRIVNQELESARASAELANSSKSEFLAKMSHEIRTPMNAIIGMSDLMPTENLSPLQKGYFEDIKKMSRSLLTIINDILDISKIESGKLELAPVHYDLRALYDNVASMAEFIAQGKSLEFRRSYDDSLPDTLYGDEIRVRQIFTNILTNAVKYTKSGYVSFSVSHGARKDAAEGGGMSERLVVEFKDSGMGIKEEDISKLFLNFQRFDAAKNRNVVGTGLGLAIVKNLVSMMGGDIDVASVYGEGSTFTVRLPLEPGDAGKVEKTERLPMVKAAPEVSVLVVDDVPVNLTVALGLLLRHGVQAETSPGGVDAVEKVRESVEGGRPYDLVFMDHMMPDMDGVEAAKRIRALGERDARYLSMPIVALSANAVEGAEELFLSSGMNGFVSKPIEPAALNAALKKFLPPEKYTMPEEEDGGPAGGEEDARKEALLEEMSRIEGLDVAQGLHYAANMFETYVAAMKRFAATADKGIALIRESLVAGDWKPYTVQVHAYKGICASIGAAALSEWGKKLEAASKGEDKTVCLEETESFCRALEDFSAALRRSSLFTEEPDSGTEDVGADVMASRLAELMDACEEGRAARIKAAANDMKNLRLAGAPADFESGMEKVLDLVWSMDYDDAVEKARELYARLETMNGNAE